MKNRLSRREGALLPTPDHGRCPNCDASMSEYIYELDILNVVLLIAMSKRVKERIKEGLEFTAANQVHVPSLPGISHGVKCRTTQSSKLGLITKMKGKGSKGVWIITSRGFAALAGQPVPSMVKVFRNKIEERFSDKITFTEARNVHIDAVMAAIERRKDPKRDYRIELGSYAPEEWYQVARLNPFEN